MDSTSNTHWFEQIPDFVAEALPIVLNIFGALSVIVFLVWSFRNLIRKFFYEDREQEKVLIDITTLHQLYNVIIYLLASLPPDAREEMFSELKKEDVASLLLKDTNAKEAFVNGILPALFSKETTEQGPLEEHNNLEHIS